MDKSLKKIAKDLAKSIHQSECNFHRKVISEWIHHTQIDVLVAQSVQAVKDRVRSRGLSEEEIATLIHSTRTWQALHLEVVAEILEDVKKRLAQEIHTEMDKRVEKL